MNSTNPETNVSREDVASIIDILAENYSHDLFKRDPRWDWEYMAYQKAKGMWTAESNRERIAFGPLLITVLYLALKKTGFSKKKILPKKK